MKDFLCIHTEKELRRYIPTMGKVVTYDTETTGLDVTTAQLIGISIYAENTPAFIFVDTGFFEGIPLELLNEILNPVFEAAGGIAHNAKYDLGIFKRNGFVDIHTIADTLQMVQVYDPNLRKKLEERVKEDFGYSKQTFEQIIGKKWGKINWWVDTQPSIDKKTGKEVPPLITADALARYACEDVWWTRKLYERYQPLLEADGLTKVHERIEIPMVYVLRDMKDRGVYIDVPFLNRLEKVLAHDLKDAEKHIYEIAGSRFNINSGPQRATVLFDKMGMPHRRVTKTGVRSTDAETIEMLAEQGYPIAIHLQAYADATKLLSTYVRAIPTMVNADGRLRCDFNSDGARTGRMSSSKPNLQNQPNDPRYPVRQAFTAPAGYKLGVADWSQIEPRLMAHMSQDPKLIKIYENDGDIYIGIASDLGITRSNAKVVQLAISYGLGPDKLAYRLGLSKADGENIIAEYYATYSVLRQWKEQVEHAAVRTGYVKNMFGRIRRLPELKSRDKVMYYSGLRKAVNTKIQGSAADLMKLGLINLHGRYLQEKIDAHLLLVVHDEYVSEAPDRYIQQAYDMMVDVMENLIPLRVPIKAEGKICDHWAQMKDKEFLGLATSWGLTLEDLAILGLV